MNQEKILDMIITNIRAALELRDMDEKEFCQAVGVSDRYLTQKRDDIGVCRLILMCEILKIKPENILDEGYATEARKEAIRGKIESLTRELNSLEPFMPEPIEDTPVKK